MKDKYSKAYKEVIEILNFVPKESVDKIPERMLETLKTKMDKNYKFTVDIDKNFEEQNLLDETKAILANIFRDYWATPYQKEKIEAKEKYDRQKLEDEKKEKYNHNEIFKKEKNETREQYNNFPIEVKPERFYQKLIILIKKIFHI